MILYHGSTLVIREPDVLHSQVYLDFGPGFYLTSFVKQAERWAARKAMRKRGRAAGRPQRAVVNVYNLSDDYRKMNVLSFGGADEQWLEFVCACRRGENVYQGYDMIVGNVADDDVFRAVSMYLDGTWDKERTLRELTFFRANDQYCMTSQAAIDKNLRFVRAYEVIQ